MAGHWNRRWKEAALVAAIEPFVFKDAEPGL